MPVHHKTSNLHSVTRCAIHVGWHRHPSKKMVHVHPTIQLRNFCHVHEIGNPFFLGRRGSLVQSKIKFHQ